MTKGKGTGQKDNINDQIFSLRILPGSDLNSLKDSLWIIKISTQPDVEKQSQELFLISIGYIINYKITTGEKRFLRLQGPTFL